MEMLTVDEEAHVMFDDMIDDMESLASTWADFERVISNFTVSLMVVFIDAFGLANLSVNVDSVKIRGGLS
jgi:hypothetical protein